MVPIVKDTRIRKEMGIALQRGFLFVSTIQEIPFGFFALCVM
jgi:hypothetical protein